MSASKQNETGLSPQSDYEWRYEYYYDEEPVSFEGLRAYRYSIVVGFWVGLAVFVIFMFFVLTLLTKTGAPQPDGGEAVEKRLCLSHAGPQRPLLDSHYLFQCNVQELDEEERGGRRRVVGVYPGARRSSVEEEEAYLGGEPVEDDETVEPFLPNTVMSEHHRPSPGQPSHDRVTD